MSAYKTLKAETNTLQLEYWGKDDLGTAHEATVVIDNSVQFQNEIDSISGTVSTMDDMCDYFFLMKLGQMEEVAPLIKTAERRGRLWLIVNIAKKKVKQFKKSDLILFVNVHFAELLSAYETQAVTTDFVLKMQNGINNDVFLYLTKEKAELCICNFMDLKKKFQKDVILSKALLEKDNLLTFLNFHYRELYQVLEVFYSDASFADKKNIAEEAIEQLEVHFDSLLSKNNYDECISFSEAILGFYRFLVKIKHIYAKKEAARKKQIEEQELEWLKIHGQTHHYSFSIKEIMDALHTESDSVKKFVLLTQRSNQEKQCLESHFEDVEQSVSILDMFTKESMNDAYFTYSKIHKNKLLLQIGGAVIRNIFLDEKLEGELISVLRDLLIDLQTLISIDAQEMLNEIMMAFSSIKEAEDIVQKEETITCAYAYAYGARCYAAQMLLCASIEKLLRCFYKEKAVVYVADSMIQLGGLVKDETIIQPALGQGLIKAVGYELSRYAHIGDGLRNRLAHLNGVSLAELTILRNYQLYFLYLCVLSRIATCCFSAKEKDKETS